MIQGSSGDGGQYMLGAYLATITDADPRAMVVSLFSAFLAPSPEGFSGYFAPSKRGWEESRVDQCELCLFRLPEAHKHLVLLYWQTDDPGEVTSRHMKQWGRAWAHVFSGATSLEPGALGYALAQGVAVAPRELGLDIENAGARREMAPAGDPGRVRRWFR